MKGVLSCLMLALGYFPYVLTAVQAVETVAGSSPGAAKKDLVLSSILAASKVGEQVPESHVAVVSSLIDAIVTALNASGIFKKKAAAPTVTP